MEDIQDESSYGFIPESDSYTIDTFKKRLDEGSFWCIDEDYEIYGDYDGMKASNLMVVFDRCNVAESSQCATEEEFNSALELSYI